MLSWASGGPDRTSAVSPVAKNCRVGPLSGIGLDRAGVPILARDMSCLQGSVLSGLVGAAQPLATVAMGADLHSLASAVTSSHHRSTMTLLSRESRAKWWVGGVSARGKPRAGLLTQTYVMESRRAGVVFNKLTLGQLAGTKETF